MEGGALNAAKAMLAFETTQLAHGREEALLAFRAAQRLFGRRDVPADILPSSSLPRSAAEVDAAAVPSSTIRLQHLKEGIPAFRLFHKAGLAATGAAARRLIDQGGAYVNGERIDSHDRLITDRDLTSEGALLLRSGKKRYHRLEVEN